MMETLRHGDDRLHCLRLDWRLVTGALHHMTPNSLTHCHIVILCTTVVPVLSLHTVMHVEYPSPPLLPSQLPRRGSSCPSHLEDEETEGQREQVNLPRPQFKKGVELRHKPVFML